MMSTLSLGAGLLVGLTSAAATANPAAATANANANAGSKITVNTKTHGFLDDFGRTRVFHGMNAVYKVAPWLPDVEGFDPENSLSDIDARNLKEWGFNIVRLGVMWPGVEPGARGDFNMTYLSEINKIVVNLEKEDIFVILDLHQDIWHRKFCGEGVPDYVYDICVAEEPEGTQSFPEPAVHGEYPSDGSGDPALEACQSSMFATYYLSAEVGAGFQCLYDNKENLWDAMGGFWSIIATSFKDSPNVLGYELINEPWAGDVYEDPRRLLPGVAESKYLQPLYEHLHKAIRGVDDEKIIFFEGLTIDYWPNAFTEGCPGGAEYNDRQAMAYHIYCPLQDPAAKGEAVCDLIDDEFFYMRNKDADRLGSGMLMTEFGAAENIKGDIYALESLMRMADDHQQSWMYWQYKYYNDITTCTPGTEGSSTEAMYFANGTVSIAKLTVGLLICILYDIYYDSCIFAYLHI
jgi:endoglycosylceramidase